MTRQRWCSWHRQYAGDTVLIVVVEVGSGPGVMHYACGRCRSVYGLAPLDPADGDDAPRNGPEDARGRGGR